MLKTQGIVIKQLDYGEADKILTVLTKEAGKISVIAKGIRKPLSKWAGHLELFVLADLVLIEGRNFYIFSEAESKNFFPALRESLKSSGLAYFLAEILNKTLGEDEPQPKTFDLFLETLDKIGRHPNEIILPYFIFNLFGILGFRPEVGRCVICAEDLKEAKHLWNSILGGIICACSTDKNNGIHLSSETIKVLRLILTQDKRVFNLRLPDELLRELKIIAENFLETLAEKKFKSQEFLEKVKNFDKIN